VTAGKHIYFARSKPFSIQSWILEKTDATRQYSQKRLCKLTLIALIMRSNILLNEMIRLRFRWARNHGIRFVYRFGGEIGERVKDG